MRMIAGVVRTMKGNQDEVLGKHETMIEEVRKNKEAIDKLAVEQAEKARAVDKQIEDLTDRVTHLEVVQNANELIIKDLRSENEKNRATLEKVGNNQSSLSEAAVLHEKVKRQLAFEKSDRQGMMLGLDMTEWPRDECLQREKIIGALVEATTIPEEKLRSVIISHQTLGKVKAAPPRQDRQELPNSAPIRLDFRSQYTRGEIGKTLKDTMKLRIQTVLLRSITILISYIVINSCYFFNTDVCAIDYRIHCHRQDSLAPTLIRRNYQARLKFEEVLRHVGIN